VDVYFANKNKLKAKTPPYEVTGKRWLVSSSNLPEGVLKEYFKGPGSTEKYSYGYIGIYDGFTGFTSLEVQDGIARVYLKGACNVSDYDFTIADLIKLNLKQYPQIQYVKIYDESNSTQNPDGAVDSVPLCLDPALAPTKTPSPTITPSPTKTPSPTRTPTRTPRPSATPQWTLAKIYFVDSVRLNADTPPFEAAGKRWVPSGKAAGSILDEYFKGPGYTEKRTYKWIAIYSGFTGYSKFEVTDGVARVYLKGTCNAGGDEYNIADLLMVNLKQFSDIQFVKIHDENGSTQTPDGASDSIPACLEP